MINNLTQLTRQKNKKKIQYIFGKKKKRKPAKKITIIILGEKMTILFTVQCVCYYGYLNIEKQHQK